MSAPAATALQFDRLLHLDADSKSAFVLCTAPEQACRAVVVLSRRQWTEDDVRVALEDSETRREQVHGNDKFSKFVLQVPVQANPVEMMVICPANDVDVAKYSEQRRSLIRETPSVYASVTLPFVQALPEAQTAWVRAILSKEQEADKILYEDDFCMLLPDAKWTDVHDLRSMHTLALLKDTSVRSVRDLTGAHLQPLKQLRAGVYAELLRRYNLCPDQVRAYVHYLPSFWMAHIHFAALTCPRLGMSTCTGKAILLDDIIDALERDADHFQTSSITYVVGERDDLYARLVQAGVLVSKAV